uniref:Uncharacterized protein n=1 Tax=Terrapene triunguis TaxID=2587831 RepID=A0A674IS48_9SAUR
MLHIKKPRSAALRRQLYRRCFIFWLQFGGRSFPPRGTEGPTSELPPKSRTCRPFPLAAPSTCFLRWFMFLKNATLSETMLS